MIVDLVKKGEVDFGIVLDNEDFSTFHTKEIHRGEYRLYRAKRVFERSENKFLLSEERKEVSILRQHFSDKKLVMNASMEVSSWEVIASLTEQGLGIGFFPDYILGKRALVEYESAIPRIPYRILAIFSKNRGLSRNAKMFIDLMSANPAII